jgi:hypothetical protein
LVRNWQSLGITEVLEKASFDVDSCILKFNLLGIGKKRENLHFERGKF